MRRVVCTALSRGAAAAAAAPVAAAPSSVLLPGGACAAAVVQRRYEHSEKIQSQNSVVRVRSDTKTSSLSGWLTQRLRESKDTLSMTTIGMSGLNQMIKALSVAQELLQEEGLLYCRASKAETVTEKGSPASYFAVQVNIRPPTDLSQYNVAPNRVGASSHASAIMQIAESAQKLGQACCLSVAGPESVQKGVLAIASLNKMTEFIPSLAKNEDGEYTAIHLKVLPLPGSARVVFVSKYTKPAKLAGYLRHTFKELTGSKIIKLVASVDSHEAVRAAIKGCEMASDFLEQDRIPLTMTVEAAQDDDALSSGSYVLTLSKELAKESTALRVTVGLGNLRIERVIEQIQGGVESGRIVHLRATLQGAPVALEALSAMSETCPVTFYSRPKDISVGTNKEKVLSPQSDRFFLELMVERLMIPLQIDFKANCESLLEKAAKIHKKFTLCVHDVDRTMPAVQAMQNVAESNVDQRVLRITAVPVGIGMHFTIEPGSWDKRLATQSNTLFRNLQYHDGPEAVLQAVIRQVRDHDIQVAVRSKSQMAYLMRALSKHRVPFYLVPPSHAGRKGFLMHIEQLTAEEVDAISSKARPVTPPQETKQETSGDVTGSQELPFPLSVDPTATQ